MKSKKILWEMVDANSDGELSRDELDSFLNPKHSENSKIYFRKNTVELRVLDVSK